MPCIVLSGLFWINIIAQKLVFVKGKKMLVQTVSVIKLTERAVGAVVYLASSNNTLVLPLRPTCDLFSNIVHLTTVI